MKNYITDFVEQFFDKSETIYNLENLPKFTIERDSNILNLEIQHYLKNIFDKNTNFHIAWYYENTSDPEYRKVFPEYLSRILKSESLIFCKENSITHSSAKFVYTITYRIHNLINQGLWVIENISKDDTVYCFLFEKTSYDRLKNEKYKEVIQGLKIPTMKEAEEIKNTSKKFTFIEKLLYSIDADKTLEYYKDDVFYPNTLQNNVDNLCEYYENDFNDIKSEVERISRIQEEFSNRFNEKISLKNIFELCVDTIFDYNVKWQVEDIIRDIQEWGYRQIIVQDSQNELESSIYKVYSNAYSILESYKNYILVEIGFEFYLYFYIPENELKVLYENRKDEKLFNEKFNNYCLNQEEEEDDDGEDVEENARIKEEKTITVQLKSNEAIVDKEYLQKLENLAKNINRSFNNIVQV